MNLNKESGLQLRKILLAVLDTLTDDVALEAPLFIEQWEPDKEYAAGNRVRYGGLIYKATSDNTNAAPEENLTKWDAVKITTTVTYDEWTMPTTTSGGYAKNVIVQHNGIIYISNQDNNWMEPGMSTAWDIYG